MEQNQVKGPGSNRRGGEGSGGALCGASAENGYPYGKDTVWQREFEEMFPFEETEDQLLAIDATKRTWRARRSWTA